MTGQTEGPIDPQRVRDALARTVRMECLCRRRLTIAQLADEAGIGVNRLRKLVGGDPDDGKRLAADELLAIWGVLGAAAARPFLAMVGLEAVEADIEPDEPNEVAAELLAGAATLLRTDSSQAARVAAADAVMRAARALSRNADAVE